MKKIYFPVIFLLMSFISNLFSQVELVPVSHSVYNFLDRMSVMKLITSYSPSMKPISRRETAVFLTEIKKSGKKLNASDRKYLEDFFVEFEYDISKTSKNTVSLFSDFKPENIFRDKKQKYLLAKTDSSSSFFFDGIGELKYAGADGDSIGKPHLLLGSIGIRLRGTLFNQLGYFLRMSNGMRLSGTTADAGFASKFDPMLASIRKFNSEGAKTFDSFEGYLRFSPAGSDWFGLTAGREALSFGTGFTDKIILSKNTAPFDFIKIDISYKKIKYSFFHSSITGHDSSGNQLDAKYLVVHRLELGPLFNNFMRMGFSEMMIYSNVPLNFAFLNPLSFLTSADLNTEIPGKNSNNTLIVLDAQFFPVKRFSLQGSLLIDDLNFETLGKSDKTGNDNKFAYQIGINWQDAFFIQGSDFVYEYSKVEPFVYSHREINNSYSNWDQPMGLALTPNSDEHAFILGYSFGSRINISVSLKLQRSGMNITDSLGNIITNVGSDILKGNNDFLIKNVFLNGLRVDKKIITAELSFQPIHQYYIILKFMNRTFDFISQNRKLSDNVFWGTFRVDF